MKTLKAIGTVLLVCAIGVCMFLYICLGMLCLALRDCFLALAKRVTGRLRGDRYQPKIFYAGRDGVPNLVVDADGFVEPPATGDSAVAAGKPWRQSTAACAVQPKGGTVTILTFPTDAAERKRLIDSRAKQSGRR